MTEIKILPRTVLIHRKCGRANDRGERHQPVLGLGKWLEATEILHWVDYCRSDGLTQDKLPY